MNLVILVNLANFAILATFTILKNLTHFVKLVIFSGLDHCTANICWKKLQNIGALSQQISISEIAPAEAFPIFHSTFLLFVSAGFLNKSTS